jgi:aminopeptidase N
MALACAQVEEAPPVTEEEAEAVAGTADVHSFSEPELVRVEHLSLDLTVDFEARRLRGRADLTLENPGGADHLVLDTRHMEILSVDLGEDDAPAEFTLGDEVPHLGRPLEIALLPGTDVVRVTYETLPEAAALQWLDPEQTAGGEHPFLFTQSQAILARTWVPCQDTPAVRMTYDATIRVPPELLPVMSAENPTERNPDGVYRVSMPQAIPSYLLALAVGDLELRSLGPETGVYAEPSLIEAAAHEFADTQKMLDAVEEIYGPYRWGRYDLLVLPPSFPFGGMENPRLTFVTPTVIAGDRSLTALIAHELAHSWSGNLVTNATWNDFWLNEGFTVYLERRIMEALYGRPYSEMLAELGRQDLAETLAELEPGSADAHLLLDLEGRNPDDGMTDVAYEKGYLFLRRLEEAAGRERWDPFLRRYFDAHAFRSVTTADFLAYLEEHLLDELPEDAPPVDTAAWVSGPGLPETSPAIHSERLDAVEGEIERFVAGADPAALETAGWTTHEWLHFLRNLSPPLAAERMAALDDAFGLTATGNSEILFAWLRLAIRSDYEPAYPRLEEFLTSMGRRKFLKPLYTDLAATEEGKARARAIYEEARPRYHSLAVATVDEILE